jgi:alpha-mannosidase
MRKFEKVLLLLAPAVCLILAIACFSQTTSHTPPPPASAVTPAAKPDLTKEPVLYVVGYAHLDTEWRWEYPQVINEYLRKTMEDNFKLFDKYPHYVFNFSGANRYRLMKEYYPANFAKLQEYVKQGRWFPAGSSMEEGDVNTPSAEAIIRQILYGNEWFRKEFGKASAEYMLPDCFGFPTSLPTILAHSGVKGFSTQKLVWGSSAPGGGPESWEKTPEGTPFNVGVWVGPDGESVLAGLNPGSYSGGIETDLSKPLPPLPPNPAFTDIQKKVGELQQKLQQARQNHQAPDQKDLQQFFNLREEMRAFARMQQDQQQERYQDDWATRVEDNGKVSGVFTDYHYYGTGDTGGSPDEDSVKRLEAIVTKGKARFPSQGEFFSRRQEHPQWPEVEVGNGPVHVASSNAEQMFLDITRAEAAGLPRYTGEMELTNHSAGSLTSQGYQKRWLRKEELLAEAAEEASIAAEWLGGRSYPLQRLNDAWALVMGGHFHDIAAGTATPKAYEFAWNDDVIAMNQFAGVLSSGTQAVAAALNTEGSGVPVVVFNPLNIAREDVVEASVDFPGGMPKSVRVTGPDGKDVPVQISDGKIVFIAKAPSVGYAVYDVHAGAGEVAAPSSLRVSKDSLENQYYRIKLNAGGDVSSIFDKSINRELLAAPARLAISYDNPRQWPAWNMDWDQEQAAPKAYVSGSRKIRVVENGPARVALEVARETAGSWFVQTIRLSAGDGGKGVEFANAIDWNTRESNLKATFPLTASNRMATYNWDIGTIERPTAQPRKFEVPSHQWIDLTDMSGEFGATVLTDCKNGSDKPNDDTIRLTLLRTPGTTGGYADQGTQDLGHHEFVYGIAGHSAGWRSAETDWQGQRLNDPLIAFQTSKHAGALGRSFSLLKVSNSRIRLLALKKAEQSNEVIVRLVELDGKPQANVRISFAASVTLAREVNGQEQEVGPANVAGGALVTSFGAYQPRTFAVTLAAAPARVAAVHSAPVALHYDLATASNDGTRSTGGFDGRGDALPAEMLPQQITFDGVQFHLAQAKTGAANAIVAKGQTIDLPSGSYNRVYVVAASADADQKAAFEVGGKKTELNIQNWDGFIGQWDDRQWASKDTSRDNYGEMTGIKPGFIKRADLAWFCSHHHNAAGENIPYSYSYLFVYTVSLPPGAKTVKLPDNDKVRILAMSVAEENPEVRPAQPLYDELPARAAGPSDFSLSTSATALSVPQGMSATMKVRVTPRSGFKGNVFLTASGLPPGVTAVFSPASTSGTSTMTLTAAESSKPATAVVTITGVGGGASHTATASVTVSPVVAGTTPVDLSSAYNVTGIYDDGATFTPENSLDGDGYAFSKQLVGAIRVGDGVVFKLGPANALDVATGRTVPLPSGEFSSLRMLAVGTNGSQEMQTFLVTYTNGTSSSFTQSLSDWNAPRSFEGESVAASFPYRLAGDGTKDDDTFQLFAYSFALDKTKVVSSISLPNNRDVLVFAMTLLP